MKILPEPAHECGYPTAQIQEILTAEEFKKFIHWMDGQTIAVDEETWTAVVYADDLQRFMRALPVVD